MSLGIHRGGCSGVRRTSLSDESWGLPWILSRTTLVSDPRGRLKPDSKPNLFVLCGNTLGVSVLVS